MIWIVAAGLAGMVVVAVAGWARASRHQVEKDEAGRRAKSRLDADEAALLARLQSQKRDSES